MYISLFICNHANTGIRDTSPVNDSGEEFNPYSDFIKIENEIYDEIEKNNEKGYGDKDTDRHDGGYSNVPEIIVCVNDDDCHLKGYLLRKQGKFEEAIEEYSRALELHPGHFRTLFNRAFAYDKVGLIEKALVDYTAALGVDPNNAFVYYNRGISKDRLRRLEEAISDFTRAIQIHPECPDFYHNRAFAYEKLGLHQASMTDYCESLRLRPGNGSLCLKFFNLSLFSKFVSVISGF